MGLKAIVEGNLDPSKDLDYYEDNGLLVYEIPALQMDIVSQVKDETIKVAPYLLVKTTDIKPLRKPVDYIEEITGGCGGGGSSTLNRGQAPRSTSSSHLGFRPRHLGSFAGGTTNVSNSSIDQR